MKIDIKWLWEVVRDYIEREYREYKHETILALLILDQNLLVEAYKKHIENGDDLVPHFLDHVGKSKLKKEQIVKFSTWLANEMWKRFGEE